MKGLRKACPGIPDETSLPELFASLREGVWMPRGKKLAIVLDQFEQWLHAHRGEEETQLVQALRHCDGERVQCVVTGARRLLAGHESVYADVGDPSCWKDRNVGLVDLFDPLHARKVLAEFGRAYGRLPENVAELAPRPADISRRRRRGTVPGRPSHLREARAYLRT